MAFIQMSVPLVFWGQRPPAHEITCICRTEEKKGVATASRTGQVVLWDILKERGTEKIKVRERERERKSKMLKCKDTMVLVFYIILYAPFICSCPRGVCCLGASLQSSP